MCQKAIYVVYIISIMINRKDLKHTNKTHIINSLSNNYTFLSSLKLFFVVIEIFYTFAERVIYKDYKYLDIVELAKRKVLGKKSSLFIIIDIIEQSTRWNSKTVGFLMKKFYSVWEVI